MDAYIIDITITPHNIEHNHPRSYANKRNYIINKPHKVETQQASAATMAATDSILL